MLTDPRDLAQPVDAVKPDAPAMSVDREDGRVGKGGAFGGWLRGIIRLGLALALGYAALVLGLGLLYGAVTPVSTLMLGRWLTFQPVARDAVSLDTIAPASTEMARMAPVFMACRRRIAGSSSFASP